jgi:hypothetical protein
LDFLDLLVKESNVFLSVLEIESGLSSSLYSFTAPVIAAFYGAG